MISRILGTFGALLAAVVITTLAVVNRHEVRLVLDPFNRLDPAISTELPLYVYLLGMLMAGVVLGSAATWTAQGKWRRLARLRTHDGLRWKGEAERLMRERDGAVVAERNKRLPLAS